MVKVKTLVNGEYFVKLTEGGNLIGTIQELTEDGYTDISLGSIEDYSKYPFDASVTNKSIRIKGLSEESKYTVTVSGRAYVNNYSSDVPVEDRTFDVVKSHTVYSSNQYGIALGKDLTFSATEKSIIVTFFGGSSFEIIKSTTNNKVDIVRATNTTNTIQKIGSDKVLTLRDVIIYSAPDENGDEVEPEGMQITIRMEGENNRACFGIILIIPRIIISHA